MSVNLALPDPFVFDIVHLSLVLAVFLLIVVTVALALRRGGKHSAPFADVSRTAIEAADGEQKTATSETQHDQVAGSVSSSVESLKALSPDAALQLLSLLQQEARLIDFLHEDLGGFSDSDIGAVARVVHEGGRRVLKTYFDLAPVCDESEETVIEVPEGFDAQQIRLTGNVLGNPPYRGTLTHRGWQIRQVKLPQLAQGHRTEIIAPAEVEI